MTVPSTLLPPSTDATLMISVPRSAATRVVTLTEADSPTSSTAEVVQVTSAPTVPRASPANVSLVAERHSSVFGKRPFTTTGADVGEGPSLVTVISQEASR